MEADIDSIAIGIRRRAARERNAAYILVFLLVLVGVSSALVFLYQTQGSNYGNIVVGENSNLSNAQLKLGGDFEWLREFTRSFVRIGAVLMAVFIINILTSFARYSFRVANSLEAKADALMLSKGDIASLTNLIATMSVDIFDFAKTPTGPYDRYLDVLKSVVPGSTNSSTTSRIRSTKPRTPRSPK